MRERFLQAGHLALWFGAMNFAALVFVAAALVLTGTVDASRLRDALKVVWASNDSVPADELVRLREIRRRHEERQQLPSEEIISESIESWRIEKERVEGHAADLRRQLVAMRDAVAVEREELAVERAEFEALIAREAAERAERLAAIESAANDKIRRIYRHMSPAAVAADLAERMRTDEGKQEAAAIVRAMPERTAAEVLEAFGDPARRNEIYAMLGGAR